MSIINEHSSDNSLKSLLPEDWVCLACKKDVNEPIIQCDGCKLWYHQACVNFIQPAANIQWLCPDCKASSRVISSSNIRRSVDNQIPMFQNQSTNNFATGTIPKVLSQKSPMSIKSSVSKQSQYAIQLKRLEEEYAAKMDFIAKKYEIMSVCSSEKGSIYDCEISNQHCDKIHTAIENQDIQFSSSNQNNMQASYNQQPEQKKTDIKNINSAPELNLHSKVSQWCLQNNTKSEEHQNAGKKDVNTNDINIAKLAQVTAEHITARNSIPRKLPNFTGNPKDWPMFYSAYKSSTEDLKLSNAQNLLRLREFLKGEAFEFVEDNLQFPESVPEVIKTLRQLYGRSDNIISSIMDKIRKMPSPTYNDMRTLIMYSATVRSLIERITASGLSDHLTNQNMYYEVLNRLPPDIRIDWTRYKRKQNEEQNLAALGDYLSYLAEDASEVIVLSDNKPQIRNMRAKGTVNVTEAVIKDAKKPAYSNNKCAVCGDLSNHELSLCERFKQMSTNNRWDCVVKNRLCRTCLKQHFKSKCAVNEQKKCGVKGCDRWHHQLLHKIKTESTDKLADVPENPNLSHRDGGRSVLLRVLPVTLHNDDREIEVLALLDDGSSISLIDDEIAQYLCLTGFKEDLCLTWTSNQSRIEKNSMKTSVTISGANNFKYVINKLYTVTNLSLPTQSLSVKSIKNQFSYLKNIPIQGYDAGKPRILIGIDQPQLGATLKVREGQPNEPIATKTRLGWAVCGPLNFSSTNCINHHFHVCKCDHDSEIHEIIKNNFAMEDTGIAKARSIMSKDDNRAFQLMESTVKNVGNRYEIGLLFRYDNFKFPNSYDMAYKRLEYLERKMKHDAGFAENVRNQIQNLIDKGYAKKLDASNAIKTERTWYLPVFVVINPNKPGKFRLVWDAAARVDGISLNSMLLKGPDLLCSLPSVLYGFRVGKYAVCGDIQEMYHQIMVVEQDRECQRFLWRDGSANLKPDEYQMNVLTFGAASSPASAQFIKNKNANLFVNQYPRAVQAITEKHYVDDYLDSFSTEHEAKTISNQVKWIHHQGGFNMRNWISNSFDVLQSLGETKTQQKSLNVDENINVEKVLGMWWIPTNDHFIYSINLSKFNKHIFINLKPTKRELLKFIMSIYDPLGLIVFFLVSLKILLQNVWISRIQWDDHITDEQYTTWQNWVSRLEELKNIRINRCYSEKLSNKFAKNIQLHIFCDASEKAYSTVAYLRIEDENGVDVALVGAKSKVAPINPISIPRLELQAAVLAARFSAAIVQSHQFEIDRKVFWCDSQVVLKWMNGNPNNYRQFVSFRIGELLENTSIQDWRWVPSNDNVADDATKWTGSCAMSSDSRWFRGPHFLYEAEKNWPGHVWDDPSPCQDEMKAQYVMTVSETQIPKIPLEVNKYSNWHRLVRVNAWINRYCSNFKSKFKKMSTRTSKALLCNEVMESEIQLLRVAQWSKYHEEICYLRSNPKSTVDRKSLIRNCSPYYDESTKLIRVNGRVNAMKGIDEYQKQPIILPKEHPITTLLIDSYHRQYLHKNFETTVNEIRQKFMIPQLRVKLKSVVAQCQTCKNELSSPNPPLMSELPDSRLATFTRPFSFVGVDFFGPINVLVGRRHEKRYGVLFTCMTIRAIHLEIAHSLSLDSFIICLHSFMARRGVPLEIRCDNGTNFHGSKNEMQKAINEINDEKMRKHYLQISWKFNPPASPHQGGAWERLVRTVKENLLKVLPRRTPTDELLKGCFMEIETIINSRPLTYIPVEPNNPEALTPNHFLLGSSSGAKPAGIFSDDVLVLRKNWKICQQIGQHFWKRWIVEYTPVITRRTKWFEKVKPIEIDDIVVICDDNQPRNSWPIGRVIDTKPGKDGQVRQATIKTSTGNYTRPAVKLALLDVRKVG